MKFVNEKQRKAMFANLNKFSNWVRFGDNSTGGQMRNLTLDEIKKDEEQMHAKIPAKSKLEFNEEMRAAGHPQFEIPLTDIKETGKIGIDNRLSYCGCPVAVQTSPSDLVGAIGEKLAGSVVETYPSVRTEGVVGLYPDVGVASPSLSDIIESGVVDAYPDGMPINDYGEAFVSGKSKEWATVNSMYSPFSSDSEKISKDEYRKLKQDIEEAYGMGVYKDNEYKQKIADLNKKKVFSYFPNQSDLTRSEYRKMIGDVDDALAAGVIDKETHASMLNEIESKKSFVDNL